MRPRQCLCARPAEVWLLHEGSGECMGPYCQACGTLFLRQLSGGRCAYRLVEVVERPGSEASAVAGGKA
jgi:hypothetical protein